jgi:lysozyme
MAHRTSNMGIRLIKDHEGLRLVAYKDPVGVWTIGWGHTTNVTPGMFINEEIAHGLLLRDVQEAERCINREVKVPISRTMFDALVSFVFNLGCGAFRTSTLLKLLNGGEYIAAADQFPRWVRAGGRELPGLVRRRALEQGLFLSELQLVHNFTAEEVYESSKIEAIGSYYSSSSANPTGTSAVN